MDAPNTDATDALPLEDTQPLEHTTDMDIQVLAEPMSIADSIAAEAPPTLDTSDIDQALRMEPMHTDAGIQTHTTKTLQEAERDLYQRSIDNLTVAAKTIIKAVQKAQEIKLTVKEVEAGLTQICTAFALDDPPQPGKLKKDMYLKNVHQWITANVAPIIH